jgi:hypothetical protein
VNKRELKSVEGKIGFLSQEGGFAASEITLNDNDFSKWLFTTLGGQYDPKHERYGVPDQKFPGIYRITVERIS